jgi:acetyl/propionyl-CoA carboxylase alpha subunit
VNKASELSVAMAAAQQEAQAAFGDSTLLLEKHLHPVRHVEVQIIADQHGNVVHAFERECSIQRRRQKVVEEAPVPSLSSEMRETLGETAVAIAKAISYHGVGTVEFLLDESGSFYFLEMNTRLQVEHGVTEAITGLNLVRLQIQIAEGQPLPFRQKELAIQGHALECRLYAEDPAHDFRPAIGTILAWQPVDVPGIRNDSGVETAILNLENWLTKKSNKVITMAYGKTISPTSIF